MPLALDLAVRFTPDLSDLDRIKAGIGSTGIPPVVATATEVRWAGDGVGVKVNDYYFPAYKQPNDEYICYFAFPYALTMQDYARQLLAEGHHRYRPLNSRARMSSEAMPSRIFPVFPNSRL